MDTRPQQFLHLLNEQQFAAAFAMNLAELEKLALYGDIQRDFIANKWNAEERELLRNYFHPILCDKLPLHEIFMWHLFLGMSNPIHFDAAFALNFTLKEKQEAYERVNCELKSGRWLPEDENRIRSYLYPFGSNNKL
jgi:hypothetical protein